MSAQSETCPRSETVPRTWKFPTASLPFHRKLIVAFAVVIAVPFLGYAFTVEALNRARLSATDEAALEQRIEIAEQHIRATGLRLVYNATVAASSGPDGEATPAAWRRALQALGESDGIEGACIAYETAKGVPPLMGRDVLLDATIGASPYAKTALAGTPCWGVLPVEGGLAVVAAAPSENSRGGGKAKAALVIAEKLADDELAALIGPDACSASVSIAGPNSALAPTRPDKSLVSGFERINLGVVHCRDALYDSVILRGRADGAPPALLTVRMKRSALPGRGPQFLTVALCTFACALLLAAFLTSSVSAWVERPLDDLRTRVETIAQGGRATPIPGPETHDALGRVACAFNEMVANLDDAQKRLVHSERLAMAGKMSAAVAHEVRNVLGPIQLRAELLLQGDPNPELKASLEAMNEEVDRGASLLHNLLDFARQESGEHRPVPVADLIGRVAELLTPQFRKHNVALSTDPGPDDLHVSGDRSQLLQVLVNLLNNAAEADSRHITLAAEDAGADVRILVRDDGAGMDRETLDRSLEPFFTTKPVGEGTGLGLSICQSVVEAHKGSLAVESSPQSGTRVTVRLPRGNGG